MIVLDMIVLDMIVLESGQSWSIEVVHGKSPQAFTLLIYFSFTVSFLL